MVTRRQLLAAQSGALAFMTLGCRAEAATYPTGPVTIIEPFPPGGSIDVVTRALAPKMQKSLGKPVIVESRVGAAGVLAYSTVAKAGRNGRTLLSAASSLAANQTLAKSLPYDTLRDLRAVSLIFRTPLLLVVNTKLPVHSVKELIALLKKEPGKINCGHSGVGAAIHLAAEMFQQLTHTKMTGVGYRGVPPAINDLVQGRVQVMFADAGSIIGQVKAGRLRALGVSSTERIPALPDVPTIAEAAIPGFDAVGWTLICAPAGTPKTIIDLLSRDFARAAAAPDVKALIEKIGCIPVKSPPPAELQKFLADEIKRWGHIIEVAGLAKTL